MGEVQALRMVLGLLAALLSFPVAAVEIEEAEDLLHGRWYATEVIIFERLSPAEAGPEDLVRTGNRAYPANLRAMAEAQPWKAAELDPLTRACLEFPRLEVKHSSPCQAPAADCISADAAGGAPPAPSAGSPKATTSHARTGASAQTEVASNPASPRPPAAGNGALPSVHGEASAAPRATPPFGPRRSSEDADSRTGGARTPPTEGGPPRQGVQPPSIHPTLAPHPLLDLLSAAAAAERTLRQSSYRWLGARALQLRTEARRVRRAPDMRVIWHGRWMQPAPSRDAGEPLLLQVGPHSGGVHALEGALQITLGRYLHFQAELWRPARGSAQTPAASEPSQRAPFPYVALNQSRAMRSGELHYLDHPQIGVLVRIDPVPAPPELAAALETWKQAEAEG